MGFMQGAIEFFGGFAKILVWFLSAVVIPLTVWLAVMRTDTTNQAKDLAHLHMQIESDRLTTNQQFLEISRSLGEIKGELKRIK